MYIRRKVFSLLQDSETGEEKYFSTTDINLEDAEERIFSINEEDEAEEREFARKDYEGLTEAQKRVLKKHRSEYAKNLNEQRNIFNIRDTKKVLTDNGYNTLRSEGVVHGGGVKTSIEVKDTAGSLDNYDTLSKRHVKNIRSQQLEQAKKAGDIMRQEILDGVHDDKIKKVEEAQKRLSNYQSKKAAEKVKETPNLPANITKKEKDLIETTSKKSFKLGKKGKVALGIAGGTALAAGALYGAKKFYDKKKREE